MKHLKTIATDAEAIKQDYTVVYYSEESKNVIFEGVPKYEYVDLGLPSGLKWAKCNVGANKETDYGKYFQWGDTVGYTDASHSTWETTPFNNGSSGYDSTYFASVSGAVCPNGVLAKKCDAARVNMGRNWRMPTEADLNELTAHTNSSWETNFNGSGVNGCKFTSKSDSTKYIFIPASGIAVSGSLTARGNYGNVWSSSLNSYNPDNTWLFYFSGNSVGVDYGNRYVGFSVRGVMN